MFPTSDLNGWAGYLECVLPELEDDWPRITRRSEWVTADGRRVRVCDMTDEHLVNLLLCFWGYGKRGITGAMEMLQRWHRVLIAEAERRELTWTAPWQEPRLTKRGWQ